ncbi:U3 small nucleolar ribonucleoprotein protein IMP4-like [Trichechus manatus latirostris]|uniref:U3 small nucleolar ribonucleoprotein protein IMP4-like n=1 Tax=Trichechus manatus latirostris TaxID=127582 RepID=A0A2Y9QUQ0_TRIMA|nr:U3 small nucleolar ribonucleoprotein protein IMP4-like [Trichechus manatus latirostris]
MSLPLVARSSPRQKRSLRREARLRREYLYGKGREEARRTAHEKKERLRRALEENRLIPTELRRQALALQGSLESDDAGGEGVTSHVDDEYRWAGVEDPKIMITTSRDPSSRLKMFAKELKLVFPGAQRMNRGRHEVGALVRACKANGVTDLLVVHEHRGTPAAPTPHPRHHIYKKMDPHNVELTEVGPRFEPKLYMIRLAPWNRRPRPM